MILHNVPLTSIVVGDRQREDLGDIESLADSLQRYGQIQPIVLDDPSSNNLIAGGRRLAAATSLGWTHIHAVYKGQLSIADRQELELEENVRRKEMTWQERAIAIATIHQNKLIQDPTMKWGYQETGELLGMTRSNVAYALWVAKELKAQNPRFKDCQNMAEAIRVILQMKEDEALDALKHVEAAQAPDTITDVPVATLDDDGAPVIVKNVQLSIFNLSGIELLRSVRPESIDHIITDPPYGIDMDNLQQDNGGMDVSRTKKEHDVEENVQLLNNFIRTAFVATAPHGYCVFWCDFDHWEWMRQQALSVGWRVQRWPLIWVKTDSCQNMAAQFNFTKRTEIAMVLRKPGAALAKNSPTNFWVGAGEDKTIFNHPFAKPIGLWQWIIDVVSHPGQLICDPFAGSGTCPAAAVLTDRKVIASEIVPQHHSECVENVKKAHRMLHNGPVQFSYERSPVE